MAWAADGHLFLSVGGAFGGRRMAAQDPASHVGKMLRLRDDGTAPDDNPFVGQDSAAPEVYSLAARGKSPAAFDRRYIPLSIVVHRSNTAGIFPLLALLSGRIAVLGATRGFTTDC